MVKFTEELVELCVDLGGAGSGPLGTDRSRRCRDGLGNRWGSLFGGEGLGILSVGLGLSLALGQEAVDLLVGQLGQHVVSVGQSHWGGAFQRIGQLNGYLSHNENPFRET